MRINPVKVTSTSLEHSLDCGKREKLRHLRMGRTKHALTFKPSVILSLQNRKVMKTTVFIIIQICGVSLGHSQGFINLDFEQAKNVPGPGVFSIETTNGIPGWTAYVGTNKQGFIFYNTVSIGAAAISLQGPGSLYPILQGSYSVILQYSSGGGTTAAAIGQTGRIPLTAMSVVFYEQFFSAFQVSFAGQTIPLFKLGSTATYDILGGDIFGFAGQTGELRFATFPNSSGILDNIQFANQPIPEPSGLAFFGIVALLLGLIRRRNSLR